MDKMNYLLKSGRPVSQKQTERRPSSFAPSENRQNEVIKLQSQIEIEKKARREAEEKCKQVVAKMDVLQQRLLDKNKEVEEEREAKEDVLKGNQTLEMTINKLEGYLRKKTTRFDSINPDPDSGRQSTIDDIIRNESELEKVSHQLNLAKQNNRSLEKRCALLEKMLKDHNINLDNSEFHKLDTEVTNTELDF